MIFVPESLISVNFYPSRNSQLHTYWTLISSDQVAPIQVLIAFVTQCGWLHPLAAPHNLSLPLPPPCSLIYGPRLLNPPNYQTISIRPPSEWKPEHRGEGERRALSFLHGKMESIACRALLLLLLLSSVINCSIFLWVEIPIPHGNLMAFFGKLSFALIDQKCCMSIRAFPHNLAE